MSITSGFYNSINEDRLYNADEMSGLFEGLISDGVFQNIGSAFSVRLESGTRNVRVAPGRAWIKGRWLYNSSVYSVAIPNAPISPNQSRIDAVALKINTSTAVRGGDIVVVQGTASANPSKPNLLPTTSIGYLPIAYITSKGGTTSIGIDDVEFVVGTSECPFIIAPMVKLDINDYLALWKDKFQEWMEDLVDMLDGNQAAQLAARILNLENRITPVDHGGSGADNKADAKDNLGIKYGASDPSSIADSLDVGDIYIHIVD